MKMKKQRLNLILWCVRVIMTMILLMAVSVLFLQGVITPFSENLDELAKMNGPVWGTILVNLMITLMEILFAAYGLFQILIVIESWFYRYTRPTLKRNIPGEKDLAFPSLAIIVPSYKTPFEVIKKTLDSILKQSLLKKNIISIHVIDDSPLDENKTKIKDFCKRHGIQFHERENRQGFKAGAINHVLEKLSEDLVMILDSDHVLEKNVVEKLLLYWLKLSKEDEKLFCLQARTSFDYKFSPFHAVVAFVQAMFYHLTSRARDVRKKVYFSGSTALLSTRYLKQLGGFPTTSVAEDHDLSLKAAFSGLSSRYVEDLGSIGELPLSTPELFKQLNRWCLGILDTGKNHLKNLVVARTSPMNKFDAFMSVYSPLAYVSSLFFVLLVAIAWMLEIDLYRPPLHVNDILLGSIIVIVSYITLGNAMFFASTLWKDHHVEKPLINARFPGKDFLEFLVYFLGIVAILQVNFLGVTWQFFAGKKRVFETSEKGRESSWNKNKTSKFFLKQLLFQSLLLLVLLGILIFGLLNGATLYHPYLPVILLEVLAVILSMVLLFRETLRFV